MAQTRPLGRWWATVPKTRWPDSPEWRDRVLSIWDPVFADRRQELVFIGVDLPKAAISASLDACLVGDPLAPLYEPERWADLADPFDSWGMQTGETVDDQEHSRQAEAGHAG